MSLTKKTYIVSFMLLFFISPLSLFAQREGVNIFFTSVASKDCQISDSYENASEEKCPSPNGWQVKIIDNGGMAWLVLKNSKQTLDTSSLINTENMTAAQISQGKIEWHQTAQNISGIIFRVSGQMLENQKTKNSRLFVVKVGEFGDFYYCGSALTNKNARLLLKSNTCMSLN